MVSGDTNILTTDGILPITDCDGKTIVVMDNKVIVNLVEHKVADVYSLTTTNGHNVFAHEDAVLLTRKGWSSILELEPKTNLQLSYSQPVSWGDTESIYERYHSGFSYGKIEVTLTESMVRRSSEFLRGYLAGLFCSRGRTYVTKAGPTNIGHLRYTSSWNDLPLIQIVLGSFGIHSNIVRAKGTSYINLTGEAITKFESVMAGNAELDERIAHLKEKLSPNAKLQRDFTYPKVVEFHERAKTYSLRCPTFLGFSAHGLIFKGN